MHSGSTFNPSEKSSEPQGLMGSVPEKSGQSKFRKYGRLNGDPLAN